MKKPLRFWFFLAVIWLIATGTDRLWWNNFEGIPSWDQADYLNSALDHARAFGWMHESQWKGWKSLLDLSPKIPPLASIVNGAVMAIAGDAPKEAAWSLSIWHGLLLFSVANWGLQLKGQGFALLGAVFVAIAPALVSIRTDYVLEMPLTAVVTLALWRLGCWLHPQQGGKWLQAIIAAACCISAILVKQSSLLVLIPALTWAGYLALFRNNYTRKQLLTCLLLGIVGITPWLHHNWITTIGGTNRAVFESASREGDPSLLTIDNWVWYARLLPEQLGPLILILGISGGILWIILKISEMKSSGNNSNVVEDKFAWRWLIVTFIAGWIFTSLSPNKGDRYITPLLPSLLLLLARGWWQWGLWIEQRWPVKSRHYLPIALTTGVFSTLPSTGIAQFSLLNNKNSGPIEDIVLAAGGGNPSTSPRTIIVVPSTPDLNQHNVSYFGRRQGGNLVGRQLGSSYKDITPLLAYGQWIILAEGEQGSVRKSAASIDSAVRMSGIFREVSRFPRPNGDSYSLWHRLPNKKIEGSFAKQFPKLARDLGEGLQGLKPIFDEVAVHHMLDGHFNYQDEVRQDAFKKLANNPQDIEARWSLALLGILTNRLDEASRQFTALENLLPNNSWPSTYNTLVILANWNPWKATAIADKAQRKFNNPVLKGLGDLSGIMGGAFWRLPASSRSIPNAIKAVEKSMNQKSQSD